MNNSLSFVDSNKYQVNNTRFNAKRNYLYCPSNSIRSEHKKQLEKLHSYYETYPML